MTLYNRKNILVRARNRAVALISEQSLTAVSNGGVLAEACSNQTGLCQINIRHSVA